MAFSIGSALAKGTSLRLRTTPELVSKRRSNPATSKTGAILSFHMGKAAIILGTTLVKGVLNALYCSEYAQ